MNLHSINIWKVFVVTFLIQEPFILLLQKNFLNHEANKHILQKSILKLIGFIPWIDVNITWKTNGKSSTRLISFQRRKEIYLLFFGIWVNSKYILLIPGILGCTLLMVNVSTHSPSWPTQLSSTKLQLVSWGPRSIIIITLLMSVCPALHVKHVIWRYIHMMPAILSWL